MPLEDNKDVIRRHYEELFNGRKLEMAAEITAEDYIEHGVAPLRSARREAPDPIESLKGKCFAANAHEPPASPPEIAGDLVAVAIEAAVPAHRPRRRARRAWLRRGGASRRCSGRRYFAQAVREASRAGTAPSDKLALIS